MHSQSVARPSDGSPSWFGSSIALTHTSFNPASAHECDAVTVSPDLYGPSHLVRPPNQSNW